MESFSGRRRPPSSSGRFREGGSDGCFNGHRLDRGPGACEVLHFVWSFSGDTVLKWAVMGWQGRSININNSKITHQHFYANSLTLHVGHHILKMRNVCDP